MRFLLSILLTIFISNGYCSDLNKSESVVQDSVIVTGRVIEKKKRKRSKYVTPIFGAIVKFYDSKYKDEVLIYEYSKKYSDFVIAEDDGRFKIIIKKGNYLVQLSFLGWEFSYVDLQAENDCIDMGDIELEAMALRP